MLRKRGFRMHLLRPFILRRVALLWSGLATFAVGDRLATVAFTCTAVELFVLAADISRPFSRLSRCSAVPRWRCGIIGLASARCVAPDRWLVLQDILGATASFQLIEKPAAPGRTAPALRHPPRHQLSISGTCARTVTGSARPGGVARALIFRRWFHRRRSDWRP
jgi:hypothetical protein